MSVLNYGAERLSGQSSTLAVFTGIFLITYVAIRLRHGRSKKRHPPSLWSVPVVGSAPFITTQRDLHKFFQKTATRLGPIFSFYVGPQYAVVLNDKEAVREAYIKRAVDFSDRSVVYVIEKLNPKQYGIIDKYYTSSFRRLHQLTLSILTEFGFGQRVMEERIVIEAEDLVQRIEGLGGAPFDPSDFLNVCTMNVIASIAFGNRTNQSNPSLMKLSNCFHHLMISETRAIDFAPVLRFLPRYKIAMKKIKEVYEFVMESIQDKMVQSLISSEDSFVKRFIEKEGEKLNWLNLRRLLYDLHVAGSETTATTIHWSLMFIANHPDIQARLRRDIQSVIASDRYPSLNDMAQLPYVEAAILELLRIKSVLPLSLLRKSHADTEVGGYFIPADTMVIANLYAIHKNPNEWPEPEMYRPERFLDDAGHVIGKDRVIPFSLGKRSCLGELLARQELFLLFTTLVQKFDILPPEGQHKVVCEEEFMRSLTPTPFKVRLLPHKY